MSEGKRKGDFSLVCWWCITWLIEQMYKCTIFLENSHKCWLTKATNETKFYVTSWNCHLFSSVAGRTKKKKKDSSSVLMMLQGGGEKNLRRRIHTHTQMHTDTSTWWKGEADWRKREKINAYASDAEAGSQFNWSVMSGLKEDRTSDGNEDVPSNWTYTWGRRAWAQVF